MKEKIKLIRKIIKPYIFFDRTFIELLSDEAYDKYVAPITSMIEDLVFLCLFDKEYAYVHDFFSTPGNPEKGKPILWDNGYPPEQVISLIFEKKDSKELIEILEKKILLIKASLK